jgi:hypothetical protein
MTNRGGMSLTLAVWAACAALFASACSVYDSKMLTDLDASKPMVGKDAGPDSATEPPDAAGIDGEVDAGSDAAMGCANQTEICNGTDDDCDGKIDEAQAAVVYCTKQRPHAAMVSCVSGTCFSVGCEPGYIDLDGRPQNGCVKCGPGDCDDAGVDDAGTL